MRDETCSPCIPRWTRSGDGVWVVLPGEVLSQIRNIYLLQSGQIQVLNNDVSGQTFVSN
jgi:hypothetical protein